MMPITIDDTLRMWWNCSSGGSRKSKLELKHWELSAEIPVHCMALGIFLTRVSLIPVFCFGFSIKILTYSHNVNILLPYWFVLKSSYQTDCHKFKYFILPSQLDTFLMATVVICSGFKWQQFAGGNSQLKSESEQAFIKQIFISERCTKSV